MDFEAINFRNARSGRVCVRESTECVIQVYLYEFLASLLLLFLFFSRLLTIIYIYLDIARYVLLVCPKQLYYVEHNRTSSQAIFPCLLGQREKEQKKAAVAWSGTGNGVPFLSFIFSPYSLCCDPFCACSTTRLRGSVSKMCCRCCWSGHNHKCLWHDYQHLPDQTFLNLVPENLKLWSS